MKISRVIGAVLAAITVAPAAQAARITFDFDAFIPTERVPNRAAEILPPFFTEFKGDNRDFSLEATRNGQARLFSQVVLDTDSPDLIVSSFAEAGTSVGFLQEDGVEVSQSDKTTPISSFTATRVSDRNIKLNGEPILLNPANSVDNPGLLRIIEPVEASGTVAVYEPSSLLGLGLLAITGSLEQKTGRGTATEI